MKKYIQKWCWAASRVETLFLLKKNGVLKLLLLSQLVDDFGINALRYLCEIPILVGKSLIFVIE